MSEDPQLERLGQSEAAKNDIITVVLAAPPKTPGLAMMPAGMEPGMRNP